jgi:hypothetical protein
MPAFALPRLVDTTATRLTLHHVAEHVLAAEQYAANDELALSAAPNGFTTGWFPSDAGEVRIRVDGDQVVREHAGNTGEGSRQPIAGDFDEAAAQALCAWWSLGEAVLTALRAADGESISRAILWPEHFDIAVTLTTADGRNINLGFSPGDEFSAQPYVYAGPWDALTGPFWNAPFGAFRTYEQIGAGDDAFAPAAQFLAQARAEFG